MVRDERDMALTRKILIETSKPVSKLDYSLINSSLHKCYKTSPRSFHSARRCRLLGVQQPKIEDMKRQFWGDKNDKVIGFFFYYSSLLKRKINCSRARPNINKESKTRAFVYFETFIPLEWILLHVPTLYTCPRASRRISPFPSFFSFRAYRFKCIRLAAPR